MKPIPLHSESEALPSLSFASVVAYEVHLHLQLLLQLEKCEWHSKAVKDMKSVGRALRAVLFS